MIGAVKIDYLKDAVLQSETVLGAKDDFQRNLAQRLGLDARHHTMEGEVADIELGLSDAHFLQSTGIKDINVAAPIHEDVAKSESTDEWIHD